ncbi:MAG: hypothetical protein ACI89Z_000534 [Porticoccus sp.]|jgi:hypothetical protein
MRCYILGIPFKLVPGWLMATAVFFALSPVSAQSLRDPTLPPPPTELTASRLAETLLGIESGAITIIVRNGLPHLLIGTRLYAQGEKIGEVLIERITETEIWFRENTVLRKISLFPGVKLRTVVPLCVSSSSKLSSLDDPCVKVQS